MDQGRAVFAVMNPSDPFKEPPMPPIPVSFGAGTHGQRRGIVSTMLCSAGRKLVALVMAVLLFVFDSYD
jgi:hypothetical protein